MLNNTRPIRTLLILIATLLLVSCGSDNGVDNGVDNIADPGTPGDGTPSTPSTPGHPGTPSNPADPTTPGDPSIPDDPGTPIEPHVPTTPDELQTALTSARQLTVAQVEAHYDVPFSPLTYNPSTATHLDLIQNSALALDSDEMDTLTQQGFVISERQPFPTFVYGYATIYAEDLPLFISADSILYALHRSYSEILKSVEYTALVPELNALLQGMRDTLATGQVDAFGTTTTADLDLYLSVALSLLEGSFTPPVHNGDAAEARALFDLAIAADGMRATPLFGSSRDLDFSQFEPRGHYTESEQLKQYFRASMWLGRIDFRLIETQPDGSQVFRRRQFEAAVALNALLDTTALARWQVIDQTIKAFVGDSDNMTPPEFQSLFADLGLRDATGVTKLSDQQIATAIANGGYGQQQIASHIMFHGPEAIGSLPLNVSFLLLGQRYVIDSHVFSNVVWDRTEKMRMMPNPLDVAFAALGNNHALKLLKPERDTFEYTHDLNAMRILADAHGTNYWQGNLYTLWLGALRALSPDDTLRNPAQHGLPAIATTEPWARRILNTQLASWAELRHDTLLYATQSYTSGAACEYPDAYVDPYPEFFARIANFGTEGQRIAAALNLPNGDHLSGRIREYFQNLEATARTLEEIARYQRQGTPLTPDHMEFINQAVVIQWGCGDPAGFEGWYARLFFSNLKGVQEDPTIADVHTQPTDEAGTPVGRVLHVATGRPRLMTVTIDTCTGPRAYVGLASSYFEQVTENFERRTDQDWAQDLQQATPADVPWMQDLVVR